jgi:hypothetical protein
MTLEVANTSKAVGTRHKAKSKSEVQNKLAIYRKISFKQKTKKQLSPSCFLRYAFLLYAISISIYSYFSVSAGWLHAVFNA